jgi:superfamily II DNA or RNA helicase
MNSEIRPRSMLRPYQTKAADFIVAHPGSMLQVDLALGKTSISLTAITDLLAWGMIRGVLVIAPRRVAEAVWHIEARQWAHTQHLKVCILRSSNKKLLARELTRPYDVWVTNFESLPWLYNHLNTMFLHQGRYPPFDMVIFDEITRIKKPTGARIGPWHAKTGGVCMLDYSPRRVGLTGTPAPNGYIDLFGQYLAVDGGKRLGVDITDYKRQYFEENQYERRLWLRPGAKEEIEQRIADITVSLTSDDYLDLPPYVTNDIMIDLPPKARAQYDELEANMFAEFDEMELEVFNAAALTAKCRQVANGVVRHHEERETLIPVHDAKLEALDEILEESGGSGVIISYAFRPDAERILKRYKGKFRVAYLGPGVSDIDSLKIIEDWNAGGYDGLCTSPQSSGHGLNLQFGGHQLVHFGLTYDLEMYLQINGRLRRPGQTAKSVIIHRILAHDTVDLLVRRAIDNKSADQKSLRDAMKEYQKERGFGTKQ